MGQYKIDWVLGVKLKPTAVFKKFLTDTQTDKLKLTLQVVSSKI